MTRKCMKVLVWSFLLSSTACLSPRERLAVRYYSAEVDAPPGLRVTTMATRPELRLRRVRSAEHLGDRFIWRTPAGEYGYNDLARWTEAPLQYFERAMRRELFEQGRVVRSESTAVPTLDLELLAFEEMLGPDPSVRVTVVVRLTDSEGRALLDRTLKETSGLDGRQGQAVADGLRATLGRVVAEACVAVEQALR